MKHITQTISRFLDITLARWKSRRSLRVKNFTECNLSTLLYVTFVLRWISWINFLLHYSSLNDTRQTLLHSLTLQSLVYVRRYLRCFLCLTHKLRALHQIFKTCSPSSTLVLFLPFFVRLLVRCSRSSCLVA